MALVLVLGVATSGIMGWTAHLGGQINRPELRSETATALPTGGDEHEREE